MTSVFRGTRSLAAVFVTVLFSTGLTPQDRAAHCVTLAEQRLPNTTITAAQAVTGGSFTPPRFANPIRGLPPFCRVAGVIAPTSDSRIQFEVWLPLDDWNGRFAGVGNGGWAGSISFGDLAGQLRRGYAAASTDTGHEAQPGADAARFAFEHPERLIDFAYRAHHETAVAAKALVEAFYGEAAAYSYWIGCSSGGYEGLMEAQRFPGDFDGIVAGAPANNWTRLMSGDLDATLAVLQDPDTYLPLSALGALYRGVLASCDGDDGVVDGVLEDPRACDFDPGALACEAGEAPGACLTAAQVEAARRVYRGLRDPVTGAQLYPGLAPGSEPFWPNRDREFPFTIPVAYFKWLVFADPEWDWKTFQFEDPADYRAFLEAESSLAPILNATNPDLRDFRARGGKLLQYHGWSDGLIAPQNSIDYYESVISLLDEGRRDRAAALAEVRSFYRMFMAPGAGHCGGGPGPSSFDMLTVLEQWVEQGVAPNQVLATHAIAGVIDRSRPLCPYPEVAVYGGVGDINEAASFACRAPEATEERGGGGPAPPNLE